MPWNVAIDIGGTFTDIVCLNTEDSSMLIAKASSTPPHYIDGVMRAIEKAGISAPDVNLIIHGSTVAINTVLERKGGGYGNPVERDPKMVLEDVINGYISLKKAAEVYGVAIRVIDEGILHYEIDSEETSRLRG